MQISVPYLGVLFVLLRQRRGMTAAELGTLLEAQGSGVSAATYTEMEGGRYLQNDGRQFLRVYARILQLTDDELQVLATLWGFALIAHEMGEDLARESLGD